MFNAVLYMVVMVSLAIGCCSGQSPGFEPPVCTSRFDWDYKVLQKLSDLDSEVKLLKSKVSTVEVKAGECKDGWLPWEGKCYFFLAELKNYNDAQAYCNDHGGKLAEPPSRSANEFLKKIARQFKTENWWIGLTDEPKEGKWVWLSSGISPPYTDWKRGNPNQGRECNCGGLWYRYDYGWVDEPCSYRYNAICEI